MNWIALLKTLAPVILSTIPGMPPIIIPLVVHGIETAESLSHATGAEKKAAVLDLVQTGILAVNAATKSDAVDPVAVAGVVSMGIDTAVDAVNLVHQATAP
jgi:hypothetical protein